MHINENLTWKNHVTEVTKKVSRALFSIKQVKRILPLNMLNSMRTLYFALIHSHFSYGIVAWGNADKKIMRPAIMQQKRAIRIINNAPYNSHTEPKFRKSEILKLHDLYELESLIFVHDYLTDKLPKSFQGTLPRNSDIPNSRDTRQSNLLYVPQYSLRFAQKLPGHILPSLWNDWSKLIPNNLSRGQTKRLIKQNKLQRYPEIVSCNNPRCLECYPHWEEMLEIVLLCVIYVLLFLLLLYVLSCIFFVFPRYDKKLTCCVFDPSLLHPTVSHHELARNTFTFIYT